MSQDIKRAREIARARADESDKYLCRCMEEVAEAKPLPWVTAEDIEVIQADAREESSVYYVNDVASAERTTMPAEQFDAMFNALDIKPWGEGDEVDLMDRVQWAEFERDEARQALAEAVKAGFEVEDELDTVKSDLAIMDEKYRAKMRHSHDLWELLKRQTRRLVDDRYNASSMIANILRETGGFLKERAGR